MTTPSSGLERTQPSASDAAPTGNPHETLAATWNETRVRPQVLSRDEIAAFRRDGYLVKRDVLDKDGCLRALDRFWSCLPAHFDRRRRWTWHGKLTDCDGTMGVRRRRGRFKVRDEVRHEREWIELLPSNPLVLGAAEQLLGAGMLEPPNRIRGIYGVFPVRTRLRRRRHRGHIDCPLFHLGVIAYLDDVDAGGGGFHVWPGSHEILFHEFTQHFGEEPLPSMVARRAQLRSTRPVEITGRAGDVIFYHYRILHGPGRNRGKKVRVAMLADLRRKDYPSARSEPVGDDVWKYWDGVRDSSGSTYERVRP